MSVASQGRHAAIVLTVAILVAGSTGRTFQGPSGQAFSFNTGVALINVSATVTDENGRFVSGLTAGDFQIYEDGVLQPVQQFEAERVPVSLGIALDTSGSMYGAKIAAAEVALNRFLFTLLGPSDQVFLYRFSERPLLVQGWTTDRSMVSRALGTVKPEGETALYDTVAEAVSLAETGSRQKKAVVIISDGNDNRSRTKPDELVDRIRKSDVLVYAIGIDASAPNGSVSKRSPRSPRTIPVPTPFPGTGPTSMSTTAPASKASSFSSSLDRVNPDALHAITDDTGGRTEIVASPSDLDPVTAGIADELSRQYFLGYSSPAEKDGRWHTIEVRLTKPGAFVVRARRGFIAN